MYILALLAVLVLVLADIRIYEKQMNLKRRFFKMYVELSFETIITSVGCIYNLKFI